MTVKELIQYLQEFDEDLNILMDNPPDFFGNIAPPSLKIDDYDDEFLLKYYGLRQPFVYLECQ